MLKMLYTKAEFIMYNPKIIIYKCQKYYIQCVLPYSRLPA